VSSKIVKNRTTRWHPFSAVRGTDASVVVRSLTSAGKSYVECMLRQLVVWDSIARAIIYSKGQ